MFPGVPAGRPADAVRRTGSLLIPWQFSDARGILFCSKPL